MERLVDFFLCTAGHGWDILCFWSWTAVLDNYCCGIHVYMYIYINMFVDIPADVFEKVSTFYGHKLSRPSGDLDIHAECHTRSDISYPKFGNTGSGDIDLFFLWSYHLKCQLCTGSSLQFRLTSGCYWERVDIFETQNVSIKGEHEPSTIYICIYSAKRLAHVRKESYLTQFWWMLGHFPGWWEKHDKSLVSDEKVYITSP